jgi:hypothetical protein
MNAIFDAICKSLLEIAAIDNLDAPIIKSAVREISLHGREMDLEWLRAENSKYEARLLYRLPDHWMKTTPFILELKCKKDGKSARKEIGRYRVDIPLHYCFHALKIGATSIRLVSRTGARAEIWSKGLPRNLELSLEELF